MLYKARNIIVGIVIVAVSAYSCKKMIDVDAPINTINQDNVYQSDVTATAVLTGVYANMIGNGSGSIFTGLSSITVLAGLSADELTLYNGVGDNKLISYYKNSLTAASPINNYGSEFWVGSAMPGLYYYIFISNAAIEGLNNTTLTPSVKKQLLGEAKFLRAFFYFYLTNIYGDVPLTLTTDAASNAVLARTPKEDVYQQIIKDLKEAQSLLSPVYLNGGLANYSGAPERVRPTQWAATALLARVYLYVGDAVNAEQQATTVIDQNSLFRLTALNEAFLKNSNESVWQLQPVVSGRNTEDAFNFILPSSGPGGSVNPIYLSAQLLGSFEVGDQRRRNWVDSVTTAASTFYFPYKYKATITSGSATEYLTVLRLAEQYLIRAEARARQNKIPEAQSDLNTIRTRAGLPSTTAYDKPTLLAAILHERQVELFTEMGHRWFDLKRTNTIDSIMTTVAIVKGSIWKSTDQLYPISVSDIQKNPNLVQNPGY